ncbi:MAG: hypothetical protein AAGG46_11875, partial [Planctomycetota bacterium]
HEHVWEMFKDLNADVRRLPSRSGEPESEPVTDAPVAEEPVAEEPVAEPPVEETPVVEEVAEEPDVVEPVAVEALYEELAPESPPIEGDYPAAVEAIYDELPGPPAAEPLVEIDVQRPEPVGVSVAEVEYRWDAAVDVESVGGDTPELVVEPYLYADPLPPRR